MNKTDEKLLNNVLDNDIQEADSYNIRKNGKSIDRKTNPYIDILSKEDGSGRFGRKRGRRRFASVK